MVSSRGRQAGNVSGSGPWSPRKRPYLMTDRPITWQLKHLLCARLVLGIGDKLVNKIERQIRASKQIIKTISDNKKC